MSIRRPFFILSLPRSRSKWLSSLLTDAGRICGHDMLLDCASIADFELALRNVDGTAETAGVEGWRVLRNRFPQSQFITIHRPVAEVIASIEAKGWQVDRNQLLMREQLLLACSQSREVISFTYDQLNSFDVCSWIYGECLDLTLDFVWWKEMSQRNIQIDLDLRLRQIIANQPKARALREEVALLLPKIGDASWAHLN